MCDLFDCKDCRHKCKNNATDREVELLWEELEDIPTDENDCLCVDWQGWSKGTDRDEIWHWFDEHHSKGVVWLVNQYDMDYLTDKKENARYIRR